MHPEFTHTGENLVLERLLLSIPGLGQGAVPRFDIVHLEPGQVGRAGDDFTDFRIRIAQAAQEIAPDALVPHCSEGKIDPVQGHPVQFTLPALPVPECHRVGESAVVEIVAEGQRRGMALRRGGQRELSGELGCHAIPGKMDAAIIFEVPVKSRCNAHIVISAQDGFAAPAVQLEKVFVLRRSQFHDKTAGGTGVDPVQQAGDRVGGTAGGQGREQDQEDETFHSNDWIWARNCAQE